MPNCRPNRDRNFQTMSGVAELIGDTVAGFLGREFGHLKCAEKVAARKLGVTPRTIKNWLTRQCTPRSAELLRIMANDEGFRAEINGLLDKLQERRNAAARTSEKITARHRVLAAQSDARLGGDLPAGRRLVLPAGDIVALEAGAFVLTSGYVGVERRMVPR